MQKESWEAFCFTLFSWMYVFFFTCLSTRRIFLSFYLRNIILKLYLNYIWFSLEPLKPLSWVITDPNKWGEIWLGRKDSAQRIEQIRPPQPACSSPTFFFSDEQLSILTSVEDFSSQSAVTQQEPPDCGIMAL